MSARILRLLAAASAALAVSPVAGSWATSDPTARVDRLGWWSGAPPATLTLGVEVPLSVPSPPDEAPVMVVAGDPSGVVALGVTVEGDADHVTLSVPLAPDASDINGSAAVIEACPITAAWEPAANGPRTAAPAADCERGVPGERQPDGSWTFPLPAGALDHGVLLAGPEESAGSFRVPFTADPTAVRASASGVPEATPAPVRELGGFAAPAPDPAQASSAPSFAAPAPVAAVTPAPAPPPFVTPVATEISRHVPGIPAGAAAALAAVAVAAFVLAGLSLGRRLQPLEVSP